MQSLFDNLSKNLKSTKDRVDQTAFQMTSDLPTCCRQNATYQYNSKFRMKVIPQYFILMYRNSNPIIKNFQKQINCLIICWFVTVNIQQKYFVNIQDENKFTNNQPYREGVSEDENFFPTISNWDCLDSGGKCSLNN